MPDTATIPARIFVQRSIMAGFFTTLCIGAQMMIFIYFLPIWFQAIMGVSAVDSGIRLLAMVLPMVVSSVLTGGLTVRIGYYTPFLIIGAAIMAAGAGTLTTLQVDTPNARWIGFMVLYGWGFGNSLQAPNLAAQTVLAADDVPVGTALIIFSQLLGGAVFTSVGQNVFSNQLARRLEDVPGFGNATVIENGGATTITAGLPDDIRSTVLVEYNEALRSVFRIGFGAACVTILGALAIEWRSVKKDKPKNPTDSDRLPEEGAAAGGKDGI